MSPSQYQKMPEVQYQKMSRDCLRVPRVTYAKNISRIEVRLHDNARVRYSTIIEHMRRWTLWKQYVLCKQVILPASNISGNCFVCSISFFHVVMRMYWLTIIEHISQKCLIPPFQLIAKKKWPYPPKKGHISRKKGYIPEKGYISSQ